jgi:hypothetical protein
LRGIAFNRTRSENPMEMDVMEHKREHSKADMTQTLLQNEMIMSILTKDLAMTRLPGAR